MPLPSDEKLVALSKDVLAAFEALFGAHPGFRPAHAKGTLLTGTFTPSVGASELTRAPHVTSAATPVVVRFSNSTGIPVIPDGDPNADPRGCAIRFMLGEHVHTDIVSHSTNAFPAKNGEEFVGLLRAIAASASATSHPSPIESFLGSHPAALAFVQKPKPPPSSFAREEYFGLTAMRFTSASGVSRYGRYRIVPEAGIEHLDAAAVATRGPDYLFEEIAERIARGPISYKILVQVANDGDVVDDVTVHWPDDRPVVELGKVTLSAASTDDAARQKTLIFDPIPRVDGIEPSADPLLELRAAVYLLSGRKRREAP
ncbi:MAG TPA: catalase family peroxidase [Polyangiaceae bacterium]|jgi:catalase|nr:catalase family peroxidase [Polyangiaceae bacterium]